jgi:hypothetical protein
MAQAVREDQEIIVSQFNIPFFIMKLVTCISRKPQLPAAVINTMINESVGSENVERVCFGGRLQAVSIFWLDDFMICLANSLCN